MRETDNPKGRPRVYQSSALGSRIQVRVTEAQRLRLRRIARDTPNGMAGIVREWIDTSPRQVKKA